MGKIFWILLAVIEFLGLLALSGYVIYVKFFET